MFTIKQMRQKPKAVNATNVNITKYKYEKGTSHANITCLTHAMTFE